jgi:hypothetical protein
MRVEKGKENVGGKRGKTRNLRFKILNEKSKYFC